MSGLELHGPWRVRGFSDDYPIIEDATGAGHIQVDNVRLAKAVATLPDPREALQATHAFLLREFAEPNPETGEVVELGVREIWGVICDALGKVDSA